MIERLTELYDIEIKRRTENSTYVIEIKELRTTFEGLSIYFAVKLAYESLM